MRRCSDRCGGKSCPQACGERCAQMHWDRRVVLPFCALRHYSASATASAAHRQITLSYSSSTSQHKCLHRPPNSNGQSTEQQRRKPINRRSSSSLDWRQEELPLRSPRMCIEGGDGVSMERWGIDARACCNHADHRQERCFRIFSTRRLCELCIAHPPAIVSLFRLFPRLGLLSCSERFVEQCKSIAC